MGVVCISVSSGAALPAVVYKARACVDVGENKKAAANTKCAADKPEHEDAERTLALDQEYLAILTETCGCS